MIEVAVVFDNLGEAILWMDGSDSAYVPDSRGLWLFLEENKGRLNGIAHTHPFSDDPLPSQVDITTWAAIEAGLGMRLIWPIVGRKKTRYFIWRGPDKHNYVEIILPKEHSVLEEALRRSIETKKEASDG